MEVNRAVGPSHELESDISRARGARNEVDTAWPTSLGVAKLCSKAIEHVLQRGTTTLIGTTQTWVCGMKFVEVDRSGPDTMTSVPVSAIAAHAVVTDAVHSGEGGPSSTST